MGKQALVTAAGQGIGRAIAAALGEEGARVLATDVSSTALADLQHPNIETRLLDVTDRAQIADTIATLDSLDVLVNCAGYVHHGDVLACGDEDWDFSFNLNARSMFWTMQTAIPLMLVGGGGSIINIASVASSLKGVPNRFLYSASKAAIIGMTKATACDFVTRGIRVNAICPGTVDSPSWQQRVAEAATSGGITQAEAEAAFVARQPMGRVGTPAEVAALAVYLAGDESSFTTGQAHVIDGGWNM